MKKTEQVFLVVDDDEVFNRILCRGLTRRGFTCHSAQNVEQAMAVLSQHRIDNLILDLRLSVASGLSLIQPVLAVNPKMRIVVLTGYASLTTAVQAIKLGALNYLAKPVDMDAVLKAFELDQALIDDQSIDEFQPTSLKQLEWEHLQRVLAENDGNISATARQLGMHRRTLQRKLQKKQSNPRIV